MAVRLVEVVNPNGRKGWVAATYRPLIEGSFRPLPSQRHPHGGAPPALSASTEVWRSYAVSQGLPGDEADAMTRDEIVARLTDSKEE